MKTKVKQFPFRISIQMYDRIRRTAKQRGKKMSTVIRAALDEYLPAESEGKNAAA